MKRYDNILEQLKQRFDEGRLSNALKAGALAGAIGIGGAVMHLDRAHPHSDRSEQALVQKVAASDVSQVGKDLVKGYEGLRTKPYDDRTGKTITAWNEKATIGYGHLISKEEWETYKNGITTAQADELLDRDLERFVSAVRSTIKPQLKQNQFDALVSLAFNIGVNHFKTSSLVKLINGEPGSTYPDKKTAWLAWNRADGKPSTGLTNRRNAELTIFEK